MTNGLDAAELPVLAEPLSGAESATDDACCFGMVRCIVTSVFVILARRPSYLACILLFPASSKSRPVLAFFFQTWCLALIAFSRSLVLDSSCQNNTPSTRHRSPSPPGQARASCWNMVQKKYLGRWT